MDFQDDKYAACDEHVCKHNEIQIGRLEKLILSLFKQDFEKEDILADNVTDLNNAIANLQTGLTNASTPILAEVQTLVSNQANGIDTTTQVTNINNIATGLANLASQVQTEATPAPTSADPIESASSAAATTEGGTGSAVPAAS